MSENEDWYDREIAPKLAKLANACGNRGLSFIAVVEYESGNQATTTRFSEGAGLAMTMISHCAQTAPNLDGFVIGLARYCQEKGIDTGASIVMRQLGKSERQP
jgi:hypothetical protein